MPIPIPDWFSADTVKLVLTVWGAGLSTWLGIRELRKRRLNFSTSYAFYGTDQIEDEITIVNLSPVPVFVSYWTLVWEPRWLSGRDRMDLTPHETTSFKIGGEDDKTLIFGEADKLAWGYKVAEGRKLVLTLHLHGQRRPKRLIIKRGEMIWPTGIFSGSRRNGSVAPLDLPPD
jgi:hypothetical protein